MTTTLAAGVLAEAPPPDPGLVARNPQLIFATGLLVLVLLVGALALFLVDRWRRRQFADVDEAHESAESLSSFRALYERGELSEEEYRTVRAKMAAKIKKEVVAGQPSVGRPIPRLALGPTAPTGPADGADSAAGTDSPAGPGTGSPGS